MWLSSLTTINSEARALSGNFSSLKRKRLEIGRSWLSKRRERIRKRRLRSRNS
jgi:hypothetical protein